RISAIEHDTYAATPIEFDLLERGDPQACLDEIEALLAGEQTQRALSGLLGDEQEPEAPIRWANSVEPINPSWGVRPPLPDWTPSDPAGFEVPETGEIRRLEPRDDNAWMIPDQPIDDDPANSDAPGRPAMDE
ncbi:MAG TPA: hypothetical protein VK034_25050, partial [Enhygromyxa sp.]|nr:hypothetical protein [Enhygromyxa sp.]